MDGAAAVNEIKQEEEKKDYFFHIEGGRRLYGEVMLQGSKNAALPIMAAALLVKGTCCLHNIPSILDTGNMLRLLVCVGAKTRSGAEESGKYISGADDFSAAGEPNEYKREKNPKFCKPGILIDASSLHHADLPENSVQAMRSSVLLIGPMLARLGEIRICYPGGCVIGQRPINLHLMAMEKLGATVEYDNNCIHITAAKLKGSVVVFPFPSVGATENCIMAAMGAEGETVIVNAAREPEVVALCRFLIAAGAKIEGVGTGRLRIYPAALREAEFTIPSDRIVAGTYMMAISGVGGEGVLRNAPQSDLVCVSQVLSTMGVGIRREENAVFIKREKELKPLPYIATDNYPGFPTDMQPMLAAILSYAKGVSEIHEQIFEDRFGYAEQLCKMGADIICKENHAYIRPISKYHGCEVDAHDLRGGAALVIAALMAEGSSKIKGVPYIRRGYEDIVRDIELLGGKISEVFEKKSDV